MPKHFLPFSSLALSSWENRHCKTDTLQPSQIVWINYLTCCPLTPSPTCLTSRASSKGQRSIWHKKRMPDGELENVKGIKQRMSIRGWWKSQEWKWTAGWAGQKGEGCRWGHQIYGPWLNTMQTDEPTQPCPLRSVCVRGSVWSSMQGLDISLSLDVRMGQGGLEKYQYTVITHWGNSLEGI